MKNKGFTLIELLAVIVVLAIIALIAFPKLANIIEKARVNASVQSANGYIESINTQIISSELNVKDRFLNGTYSVDDIKVNYKGKGPSNGIVIIEKRSVKEARLCIDNQSIDYNGTKSNLSNNDYCGDTKVTILLNGEEVNSTTKGENSYTVDLKDKTNINCNNGAIPSVEGNTLTVKNAVGNITCDIGSSLNYTFTHLNDNDNNIIMVSDEVVNEKVILNKDKSVNFNLNGKKITMNNLDDPDGSKITTDYDYQHFIFEVYGKLIFDDSTKTGNMQGYEGGGEFNLKRGGYLEINGGSFTIGRGVLNSGGTLIINDGSFTNTYYNVIRSNYTDSKTIINGGHFKRELEDTYATLSIGQGDVEINDGYFESINGSVLNFTATKKNKVVINGGVFKSTGSGSTINIDTTEKNNVLTINGGTFISNSITINNASNSLGTLSINQNNNPIYISSLSLIWKPAIKNSGTGEIKIKANSADKCTNNEVDTTKGLCVIAIGNGTYGTSNDTGNGAVCNNAGTINIDGGTYIGSYKAIESGTGTVNIKNALLKSVGYFAVSAYGAGSLVNICGSKIESQNIDLRTYEVSTINYDAHTIFTNGTNSPKIENKQGTINANYTGTCTE